MTTPPPSITIAPPAPSWRTLLADRPPLSPAALRFREQLGLPTDRPVILSGHQAAFWHPGILAKHLAAAHAARALGAAAAWIVVDQDPEDFTTLRLPVRAAAPPHDIAPARWRLASEEIAQLLAADHAPAAIPPFTPRQPLTDRELEGAPALPSVGAGLSAIAAALNRAQTSSASAAEQIARATQALIAPFAPELAPLPLLFASRLAQTDFFAWFVAQLALNPCRAAQTYNAAAARRPAARIAALAGPGAITGATSGRCELPLWRLDPASGIRSRVWSDQLAAIPIAQLAPRALTLTALLRLAACDLFIHGTGGAGLDGSSGYDAITSDWLLAWLGPDNPFTPHLAPTATVTATLILPLAAEPPPTPEAAAHAAWQAHHARHDADALASPALATLKRSALAAIGATDDRRQRAEHFQRLQAALRDARTARAPQLEALAQSAADLRRRAAAGAILADRTWPFPLHQSSALTDLSSRIAAQFA